ncbi:hypothetical protein [uncultured Streptomyces sp.]|uniref:hypothetical protein n=1 Tax=uncultured Streptomyces sp. TaxID=174707 RepID=UPI00260A01E8|nr:hypothetical protein [uncultured Streptomyces sp.]
MSQGRSAVVGTPPTPEPAPRQTPARVQAPGRTTAQTTAPATTGPGAPSSSHSPAAPFAVSADGAYAARLTLRGTDPHGQDWYPERWTLDGPEPYAVPLPLDQPEEPDAQVVPLADGRVLIRRAAAGLQTFSLLYPTGPGTGELPLGAVECPGMTLLPAAPGGTRVYALAPGERSTGLWLVAGGAFGPEHLVDVPGRCSGGVWLDDAGRMLALDRQFPDGGAVKTVALDLGRGGELSPLLQIAPGSDDRLLIADADSGLFLLRSDAPGHDRLGWGVLGSSLPVRFPECLCPADVRVTPFAVQPGQMLMPESCAVALRLDGAAGSWVGVWRPAGRRVHHVAAPEGWLAGSGFWNRDGLLGLPYSRPDAPCGVAVLEAPADGPDEEPPYGDGDGGGPAYGQSGGPGGVDGPYGEAGRPVMCRPVPLGQAPLSGSAVPGQTLGRGYAAVPDGMPRVTVPVRVTGT